MATQIEAEFRLRAFPKSAIPRLTNPTFGVTDLIRDLIQAQRGEGGDNSGEALPTRSGWREQTEFSHIGPGIEYIQFSGGKALRGVAAVISPGASDSVAGFYLPGREVLKNCRVRPDRDEYPDGDARFDTLWFKAKKGAIVSGRSRWVTRSPFRSPARTVVFHAQQHPDATAEIETEKPLLACQQWRMDLSDLQIAALQKNKAGLRVYWGASHSLLFRLDKYPTFERRESGRGNTPWRAVQNLTDFGKIRDFRGDLTIRAELIAGYFVLSINEHSWYFVNTQKLRASDPPREEPIDFTWGAAPLGVTLYGVSAHIGVALIEGKDAAGKPIEDNFIRTISLPAQVETPSVTADLHAGGWRTTGTKTTFETTVSSESISYTCTLRTDGTRSPFVDKVAGFFDGDEQEEPENFLDIAPCLIGQGKGQSAEPPIMSGKQITVSVSRTLLDQLSSIPDDKKWTDYVGDYHPCDFAVRWHYDDGTVGPWIGQIRGYMTITSKETSGVNKWTMQLTLHDPMIRLFKPAGTVDERYPPLDFLFANANRRSVYGADFIKFLLRIELGQAEADRMNGNGDAHRYLLGGHPPFISMESDRGGFYPLSQPLSNTGFTFMPPWGRDVLSWMLDIGKTDFCVLFFGYPTGNGSSTSGDVWPCLCYGEYAAFVKNRPTHAIKDALYEAGDENWLLLSATVARHPEREYNAVDVWSNPPNANTSSFPLPAVIRASAQLPSSDPNAPDHSWIRKLIVQRNDLYFEGVAVWIALGNIQQVQNIDFRWPTISFPGAPVCWGDRIKVKMENVPRAANGDASDPTLGLAKDPAGQDEMFRVIRTDDLYDFDRLWWKTTTYVFPLSANEKAAIELSES